MEKKEAQKRIQRLRAEIDRLRKAYHIKDDPTASDEVFDSLNKELNSLLKQYPDFVDLNAPENRIGGKALDKFKKVKHDIKMFSIGNVFSSEELLAWEKRNMKLVHSNFDYFCELKLDGLAISLIYENGVLVRGLTRGDGEIGEDITQNLKMINTVPIYLKKPYPEKIEVRGEALIKKDVFNKLNLKNEKEGKVLFANSRNAAAGSLRQLDPKLTQERQLDFLAYEIVQTEGENWKKYLKEHSEKHILLKKLGFWVEEHSEKFSNLKEVLNFIDKVAQKRTSLPFNIDGVVININNTDIFQKLGVVGKDPRGVIAYKYPAEKATTIIEDIKIKVGRTGVLTPLAILKPTLIAGSVIGKATLHNFDQIERLGIKIGDTVVVEKAGDVIPKVIQVLVKMRSGKEKKFKIPTKCPVCNQLIKKEVVGLVAYYCINKNCPAKNQRFLEHFVKVFEIYELGPKILFRLKDEGLISDASDIFVLKKEDIAILAGFGERSAENIINEIKAKKKISLNKFIWALGILHVGEETGRSLANNFKTLEKIQKAYKEEINKIENIGSAVSESVYQYFRDKNNLAFIENLFKNGVQIEKVFENKNKKLNNKIFVLTGTLKTMSRELAKEKIIEAGGKVSNSVSKNTSFVVFGENAGSKLIEAQKLKIPILNEEEFLAML